MPALEIDIQAFELASVSAVTFRIALPIASTFYGKRTRLFHRVLGSVKSRCILSQEMIGSHSNSSSEWQNGGGVIVLKVVLYLGVEDGLVSDGDACLVLLYLGPVNNTTR